MHMSDLPNYLPNIPAMYGIKQPAPEYSQGNDVVLEFELYFNGVPIIDLSGWKLEAFVKKSLKAQNILWKAELNYHFYQKDKRTNVFCVRIPADASSFFLPGDYYLSVVGTQRIGTGDLFDRKVTLHNAMFELVLDASSPNPRLSNSGVTAVIFDPLERKYTVTIEGTEPTEPDPVSLIV
jgi:hypothetical protein